jgi:hypothetical protein
MPLQVQVAAMAGPDLQGLVKSRLLVWARKMSRVDMQLWLSR